MAIYQTLAETATRLLTKYGQPVTVTNYAVGLPDPATGIVPQVISTSQGIGVLLDFNYRNFGEGVDLGELTSRVNKRLLVSCNVVIKGEDEIFVDGALYKVNVLKTVRPAGITLLYDIWVQQ
jgi:hypothetical protein